MSESKSVALPLGYIPIIFFLMYRLQSYNPKLNIALDFSADVYKTKTAKLKIGLEIKDRIGNVHDFNGKAHKPPVNGADENRTRVHSCFASNIFTSLGYSLNILILASSSSVVPACRSCMIYPSSAPCRMLTCFAVRHQLCYIDGSVTSGQR